MRRPKINTRVGKTLYEKGEPKVLPCEKFKTKLFDVIFF